MSIDVFKVIGVANRLGAKIPPTWWSEFTIRVIAYIKLGNSMEEAIRITADDMTELFKNENIKNKKGGE